MNKKATRIWQAIHLKVGLFFLLILRYYNGNSQDLSLDPNIVRCYRVSNPPIDRNRIEIGIRSDGCLNSDNNQTSLAFLCEFKPRFSSVFYGAGMEQLEGNNWLKISATYFPPINNWDGLYVQLGWKNNFKNNPSKFDFDVGSMVFIWHYASRDLGIGLNFRYQINDNIAKPNDGEIYFGIRASYTFSE